MKLRNTLLAATLMTAGICFSTTVLAVDVEVSTTVGEAAEVIPMNPDSILDFGGVPYSQDIGLTQSEQVCLYSNKDLGDGVTRPTLVVTALSQNSIEAGAYIMTRPEGDTLNYEIILAGSPPAFGTGSFPATEGSASRACVGSGGEDESQTLTLSVPAGQDVKAGGYSDILSLNITG